MTRHEWIMAAIEYAKTLGWVEFDHQDDDEHVMLLMRAPGANEQVAETTIAKLRRAITEVGGPELYPKVEEHDVAAYRAATEGGDIKEYIKKVEEADHADEPAVIDTPEPELREYDQAAWESWEGIAVEGSPGDAPIERPGAHDNDEPEPPETLREHDPAAWESDGPAEFPEPEIEVTLPQEVIEAAMQDLPDLAPAEPKKEKPVKKSRKSSRQDLLDRCKALHLTGVSALNMKALKVLIRNVERMQSESDLTGSVHGDGNGGGIRDLSPKALHQAAQVKDQDRGGVPRPEQLFQDETLHAPKGHTLIARNGDQERDMCGDSILASVKAAWESEGWKFFSVDKAARRAAAHTGDVVIRKSGHVSLIDGRLVADEGWRIRIAKGSAVQTVKTANPQLWRSKGWTLRAVRA